VDLLVFVGGDGTARDVCRANDSSQVVIGVPSGVKMHSGVFAVNPQMAAELVAMLIKGDLVGLQLQEVRDIDEDAFRRGIVKSRYFGEMLVPQEVRYLQNVKQGGLEVEELVLNDIADQLKNQLPENVLIIMGPGSTTLGIQKNWDLDGTRLGVDLILNELLLVKDAAESDILDWLERHSGPTVLVITVIGGQGHIIGRGNQQISSKVLRKIGRENVIIVATKTKLKTLHGRPFMVDTGDRFLDEEWSGYIPVITGFADTVLYKVGY
jgi:predicted polyphosphate/ATP-dependent NAD kinase